ncbi:hypothetical protein K439DRAFT_1622369 [Ramaria rubella]|nr:hypothetical protein K439DRAFT_1622369 [Ramaria rubella]
MYIRNLTVIVSILSFVRHFASTGPAEGVQSLQDMVQGELNNFTEPCANGQVLNTSVYDAGEHQIKITTKSCPGKSKRNDLLIESVERRQTQNVCNVACNNIICAGDGNPESPIGCAELISSLSDSSLTFTTAGNTETIFEVGQCQGSFGNGSPDPLIYCFSALATHISTLTSFCEFGSVNNIGQCSSPSGSPSFFVLYEVQHLPGLVRLQWLINVLTLSNSLYHLTSWLSS